MAGQITHPFITLRLVNEYWLQVGIIKCCTLAIYDFIANLRYDTQYDDVTAVRYKSVLHCCIARMYPCASCTFTGEAENSPLIPAARKCHRVTEYGKPLNPTLDLQVALFASSKNTRCAASDVNPFKYAVICKSPRRPGKRNTVRARY